MIFPAFHGTDPCCADAAAAKYVRQPCQILFLAVVHPGEQMPEIMGKYLVGIYPGFQADLFHLPPDVAPVHGLPAPCYEYRAGLYVHFHGVFSQKPAQPVCENDGSHFSLTVYLHSLSLHCGHCNIAELRYADSCGADRLEQQTQPLIAILSGRLYHLCVFFPG